VIYVYIDVDRVLAQSAQLFEQISVVPISRNMWVIARNVAARGRTDSVVESQCGKLRLKR